MIPYILLFLLFAIGSVFELFEVKNRGILTKIAILYMILLVILRDNLGGTDYYMYTEFYKSAVNIKDFFAGKFVSDYHSKHFEWGFCLYCCLVKTFDPTKQEHFFFFISGIATIIPFYIALKKYTKYVCVAIIFFLYKAFFWHDFTIIRQAIGISIFMLSIEYIKTRRIVPYMLCSLIAFELHNSAIILFPLYFFAHKKLTDTTVVTIVVVAALLNISNLVQIIASGIASSIGMEDRIAVYLNNDMGKINPLNFIEIFGLLAVLMLTRKRQEKDHEYFNIFLNFFIISSFLMLAFASINVFSRFKEFFVCSYLILIAYILESTRSKNNKIVILSFIILYSFAGYIRYILVFDDGALNPYKSILPW